MKRLIPTVLITVLTAAPLAAQAPAGWKMRVDRSTSASDPDGSGAIKFVTMGTGFHATNPQAATYYNPANTASGNYSLKGTFTLVKPSGHTNYYGLVFGGAELEGANQNYIYFMVAQDGTWMIKHRAGEATHDVAPRAANSAVAKPDVSGKSINALEVRVTAGKIDYIVNGTTVHSTPRSGMTAKTDGIHGIRVNHLLEVHVDGLSMTKL
jgi:hypothetical protein